MNLRKQARETLDNVSDASKKVVESSSWATIALIGVTAISLLALGVAVIALTRHDGRNTADGK